MPTPKEQRVNDVKEKIIKNAMIVFSEYGYNAPVESIAKKASLSKGLIFWYFRTKEELILEVAIKCLPTDLYDACVKSKKNGKNALVELGNNFIEKYSDPIYKNLFLYTLSYINQYDEIGEIVKNLCYNGLKGISQKVFSDENEDLILKLRMFIGALLCYIINPSKEIRSRDYVKKLTEKAYELS
ncbi:MAG: TetR/AcrR family transcriptional regulator [Thermoplasmata archaeon]